MTRMNTSLRWTVSVYITCGTYVLLIKHLRTGWWLPVGGGIEPGETILNAAIREVKEETELDVEFEVYESGQLPGFLGYDEHDGGGGRRHQNFAFRARSSIPDPTPRSNGEWTEHLWLYIGNKPPKGTPDNVCNTLRMIAGMREVSKVGPELCAACPYHDAEEARRLEKRRKPCPSGCPCLCHDTGGGVHDHPGEPCPGKEER